MNKQEFIDTLYKKLSKFPKKAFEDQINFYIEIIDDKVEDGLSEQEAIDQIGPIDTIVEEIINNASLFKMVKEKVKPQRKLKTWEIVLITLGFPIWFPLLVAFLAVLFTLYIVMWVLILCLWVIFISFALCSVACILIGIYYSIIQQNSIYLSYSAAGIALIGLSIIMFYLSKYATIGLIKQTKKIILRFKKSLIKKEDK